MLKIYFYLKLMKETNLVFILVYATNRNQYLYPQVNIFRKRGGILLINYEMSLNWKEKKSFAAALIYFILPSRKNLMN